MGWGSTPSLFIFFFLFHFMVWVDYIPFIVLVMILYDWLIHLVYFLGKEKFLLDRKINFWPEWFEKNTKPFGYCIGV